MFGISCTLVHFKLAAFEVLVGSKLSLDGWERILF